MQGRRTPSTRKTASKTPPKTLERVISKAGLGSRTEARSWIHGRRVRVNGHVVENPDHWVDLNHDRVLFDNKPLRSSAKRYILLYKPVGYLTTYKDPQNRPTVYDLLRNLDAWVAPVGRLDLDSSGLLILSNDHDFGERLTNPEFHVPKTYLIRTPAMLSDAQIDQLRSGVRLSDGLTRPAKVARFEDSAEPTCLTITISEGRNRQVRRMLEAVGSKVLELSRIGIGRIRIGDLRIGRWREMAPREL